MIFDLSIEAHAAALAVRELHLDPDQRMLGNDMSEVELAAAAAELVANIPDPVERSRGLDYWERLTA
ncbi:hypothetical protein [Actinomadura napierensis]|uniref:Uncharacterized protein n=1 Tax=Actinomadura napierensis TaxID=267854 RepID=A0ABP5LNS0_9ACTN